MDRRGLCFQRLLLSARLIRGLGLWVLLLRRLCGRFLSVGRFRFFRCGLFSEVLLDQVLVQKAPLFARKLRL